MTETLRELRKIRFGNVKNILKVRGSMEKESIGLTIFERLDAAIDWWTRGDYADTPTLLEVLTSAKKNLDEEVKAAWIKVIQRFEEIAKIDLITFLTLAIIKKSYAIKDELYNRITKNLDEFEIWIKFCDELRENEAYGSYFKFVTELHVDFMQYGKHQFPKYKELYLSLSKGGKVSNV